MSRNELKDGSLAGLLAGIGALGMLYLLSVLRLTTFVPLDVANTLIALTPGVIATETIETVGEWGKRLVVLGGIAGTLMAAAGWGALFARLMHRQPPSNIATWIRAGALTGLLLLGPLLAIQYLVPANRASLPPQELRAALTLALVLAATGASLGWLLRGLRLLATREDAPPAPLRRAFIRSTAGVAVSLIVGGWVLGRLIPLPAPREAGAPLPALPPVPTGGPDVAGTSSSAMTPVPAASGLTSLPAFVSAPGTRPEITDQQSLYVISSSIRDPVVDPQTWRLKIHGAVKHPFEISYAELLAMPRQDQTSTLECISNEVGGTLIGNCNWNGVLLRDLLERAGVEGGVVDVVFRAADGYSDSIPIATALDPTTLVAYGIDGQALQVEHGFPARIRVPPLYGEKNVKWLMEIELVKDNYLGYWQQRGWTDDATIFTTSVFDTGNPSITDGRLKLENGIVALGGVAFAGDRGVRKIEVQIDDGDWHEARLKEAVSNLSWRLWRYDWPATPGKHKLAVRAVDGSGQLQTAEIRPTHPDGATGYHIIRVEVVEG